MPSARHAAVQNSTDTSRALQHDRVRQHTGRVRDGRAPRLPDSGATCGGSCTRAHQRSIWHPREETASPARTQNVRAPCSLVGSRCGKSGLRCRATAHAAGSAVRTLATFAWPRSASGPEHARDGNSEVRRRCQPTRHAVALAEQSSGADRAPGPGLGHSPPHPAVDRARWLGAGGCVVDRPARRQAVSLTASGT